MSGSTERKNYSPGKLPEFLDLVAKNALARWPAASCLLTSDVAWRLPGSRPEKNLAFWYTDNNIVAYAWFQANGPCIIDQCAHEPWDDSLGRDMLEWLEACRLAIKPLVPWLIELKSMAEWEQALIEGQHTAEGTEKILQVSAFDLDTRKKSFLEAAGYVATQNFQYYLTRSLEGDFPASNPGSNLNIRHVSAVDIDARVAVHKASWFQSSYNREQYLALREIPVYEPELDLVVETATGEFVSYCLGWVDRATQVGSFEPVGTLPAYRKQGLGRAVNDEGLRRMKDLGMRNAKIGTAGFNNRAYALYRSCGFDLVDKDRTYIKKLA